MTNLYKERNGRAVEIIHRCSSETHPDVLISVDSIIPTPGEFVGHDCLDILIFSRKTQTIWILTVAVANDNLIDNAKNFRIQRYLPYSNNLKRACGYRIDLSLGTLAPLTVLSET
ncbi:hypothetical protein RF11_00370 [Thelohanellus kitauei]|uniref:Uncharacterized protein n=1 Tax=Thelohanellus kitauei TaxID=669202 RepID=A0A0C2IZY0_THEKT|nr:hypothetical protein RF11_00370 [Thelohanellus kitauei]